MVVGEGMLSRQLHRGSIELVPSPGKSVCARQRLVCRSVALVLGGLGRGEEVVVDRRGRVQALCQSNAWVVCIRVGGGPLESHDGCRNLRQLQAWGDLQTERGLPRGDLLRAAV